MRRTLPEFFLSARANLKCRKTTVCNFCIHVHVMTNELPGEAKTERLIAECIIRVREY